MKTSSKTQKKTRLFLVLGVLLVLLLAVVAGGYFLWPTTPTHQVSTKPLVRAAHQPTKTTAQGATQAPGIQITGHSQQDAITPQTSGVVQSIIKLSGGGCYSYHSSSSDATVASNGQPQMYGYEGSNDAPQLGLSFDYCSGAVVVTVQPGTGYDYLRVDWWRPGRNGWSQYTTSNTTSTISHVYYSTYYEVTVDSCVSHWYGDSCSNWSPRVFIKTTY